MAESRQFQRGRHIPGQFQPAKRINRSDGYRNSPYEWKVAEPSGRRKVIEAEKAEERCHTQDEQNHKGTILPEQAKNPGRGAEVPVRGLSGEGQYKVEQRHSIVRERRQQKQTARKSVGARYGFQLKLPLKFRRLSN